MPFIFKPIRAKKTLDSLEAKSRTNIIIARSPAISHIIIDIRTKKTLDSLEAKNNRTNIIIARRPAKVKLLKLDKASIETCYDAYIIDIRTKKTLDSLEAKNRTNITCVAVQNLNRHGGPS